MRFTRLVLCGLLLLAFAGAAVAQHPFKFSVPEGWTDLSPGAPEANFQNFHPDIVTQAKSGQFVVFAMDFRDEDGYYEGMNALVREGALRTDENLNELAPQLESAYRNEFGVPVQIVEKGHVNIGGVRTIRVVYDVSLPQLPLRQVQYLMPGGQDWYTVVTYSTVVERYDSYRPVFESSANQTRGLAEAMTGLSLAAVEDRYTRLGGAFGVLLVVALVLHQSLKKKSPPPRRGMPTRRPPPRR